jgi:hypothetical protein
MARLWLPTIRLFLRDRWVRILFLPALAINLICVALLVTFFPNGENVPLHYNVNFGIDFIGASSQIYALPLVGLVLLMVNSFVGVWVWRRDRVLSYFIGTGTLMVAVIVVVAAVLSILLNR